MGMVRSPKLIAGSVGLALGNAPYKIAIAMFFFSPTQPYMISYHSGQNDRVIPGAGNGNAHQHAIVNAARHSS